MRSRNKSIKLPNVLADAGERRAAALGYPSFNAYVTALVRYDLMVRGPHLVTLPISRMPLDDQDRIDDRLLALEESGQGERGVFLEKLLARAMETGMAPSGEAIAKELKK